VRIRSEDAASEHLKRQGLDPLCLGRSRFSPGVVADLLRLVRRERPHILLAHGYAMSNFGRVVGALAGLGVQAEVDRRRFDVRHAVREMEQPLVDGDR
jgi:hypothetical protein